MARKKGALNNARPDHLADMDELFTVGEVANRLRVDGTTVRRWIKNGVLEAIALPHMNARQGYRIRKSTLDALFQQKTSQES